MPQQQIKFTIRQDGLVSEEVIGVVGSSCQELTKSIEKKLGDVIDVKHKMEYYLHQPIDNFWKSIPQDFMDSHKCKFLIKPDSDI